MNKSRTLLFAAAIVAAMFAGGVVGGTFLAKSTVTPADAALAAASPSPTPKSNEAATHEAGESAAHEQAENNGTFRPGGGGHPNEDPAHEAGESAAQEAAENARASATPSP
jgi:hypothetical protein